MWIWDQSAGELRRDGALISRGYSGNGRGKNNPAMQAAQGIGPIPAGRWQLTEIYDSPNVGPRAIKLSACLGTDSCGRDAFRIHGDSISNPGSASHGCIILPREVRLKIWASGDRDLQVVA